MDQFNKLADQLLKEKNDKGIWRGELSSSALATAVAIAALKIQNKPEYNNAIKKGYQWLINNVNRDGGYGDSPESLSNISTSLLSYAAISFCHTNKTSTIPALEGIKKYLFREGLNFDSGNIVKTILAFYGKDLTFSIPILSMLAICKVLDDEAFDSIPMLPFEFALLPSSLYRFFNLQVVSYAVPALIAVGIVGFKRRKKVNFFYRIIRKISIKPALKKLLKITPKSGGFLEAMPLTAFVALCLTGSKFHDSPVLAKGLKFLTDTQRQDGSWPIDTDLSNWVTTLSVKAMGPKINQLMSQEQMSIIREHLLAGQYQTRHPFNHAKPGGWGWTDLSGSTPDGDDTSGAILALLEIFTGQEKEVEGIMKGCDWLCNLQNSDGGIPTFCRGWGKLPFDRSCPDITAHTFYALAKTRTILRDFLPKSKIKKYNRVIPETLKYLTKNQHKNGSWLPLWFGSQLSESKENPVYGTAKVCSYLKDSLSSQDWEKTAISLLEQMIKAGVDFLISQQNSDGSFGGVLGVNGSIEETSLAAGAIGPDFQAAGDALCWLKSEYAAHGCYPTPIGLYFASLWYDEKLYPLTFYVEALRKNLK